MFVFSYNCGDPLESFNVLFADKSELVQCLYPVAMEGAWS